MWRLYMPKGSGFAVRSTINRFKTAIESSDELGKNGIIKIGMVKSLSQ